METNHHKTLALFARSAVAILLTSLAGAATTTQSTAINASAANSGSDDHSRPLTVRGQVRNSSTGAFLEGARLSILELKQETVSQSDGRFEFLRVPSGEYSIKAEYPGLDSVVAKVTDEYDRRVPLKIGMTTEIYKLQSFVVASNREGSAAAIVQQRNATNMENVVTSDAFGDIAKGQIGTFLARLPGLQLDSNFISVRGISSALTSIDMDGTRTSLPDSLGTRSQNTAAIPTETIEKAEVIKASTPATDGDSLGGRINLVTKSAFHSSTRQFYLQTGASYNQTWGRLATTSSVPFSPSASFLYSNVFSAFGGEKNLGIVATAFSDTLFDCIGTIAPTFVRANGGSPIVGERDYSAYTRGNVQLFRQRREGGMIKTEYRANVETAVTLSIAPSRYVDNLLRNQYYFQGGTVDTTLSDPNPYYTVLVNNQYRSSLDDKLNTTNKLVIKLAGKAALGGFKLNLDWDYDQGDVFETRKSVDVTSAARFSYAWDKRSDTTKPMIAVLTGANPYESRLTDISSSVLSAQTLNLPLRTTSLRLTASRDITAPVPTNIKFGVRRRDSKYVSDRDVLAATLIPRDASALLLDDWNRGPGHYLKPGPLLSLDKVFSNLSYLGGPDPLAAWKADANLVKQDDNNTLINTLSATNKRLDENVDAAFVQFESQVSARFSVLGGVRAERTMVLSSLPVRDRKQTLVRDQFLLPDGTPRLAQRTSEYTNYFPSLHLRGKITPALHMRASYSTTIGRPALSALLGAEDIDYTAQRILQSNPALGPQTSRNYDISLEYYFEPVGIFSLGAFEKNIKDFIATVDRPISQVEAVASGANISNPNGNLQDWTLRRSENTGSDRYRGMELNYSQQLSFLPGIFRGMGWFTNWTWMTTTGQIAANGVKTPDTNVIGRLGNVGLTYSYGRWDARLLWNYRSSVLTGYVAAAPNLRNTFNGERRTVDFNSSFKLSRKVRIFTSLSNITTSCPVFYSGYIAPERSNGFQGMSFVITFGLKATL